MNRPPHGNDDRRLGNALAMFKPSAHPLPDMSLEIRPGSFWVNGASYVEYAGGASPQITPPDNYAKWVLVCVTKLGAIDIVNGAPSINPLTPAIPKDYLPIAAVYVHSTDTEIYEDMVYDIRPVYDAGEYPTSHDELSNRTHLESHPITAITDLENSLAERPRFVDMHDALLAKADINGTPSPLFMLNKDATGIPAEDVGLMVERGTLENVGMRWNESGSTNTWEFTNDGIIWYPFATTGSAIGEATDIHKGLVRLTLPAANPTNPLAVGDNDPRLLTGTQKTDVLAHIVDVTDPHDTLVADVVLESHLNPALRTKVNGKVDQVVAGVEDNIAVIDSANGIKDSGVAVSAKIDTVPTALTNNIAMFNGSGNVVDSGSKVSDLEPAGTAVSTVSGHEATYTHTDLHTQDTDNYLASPATRILCVDGNRSDTYVEDGTITKPFKTILSAINKVISNGDNSTYPYVVTIAPGIYAEQVALNNSSLVDLSLIGYNVTIAPASGYALYTNSNNNNLVKLKVEGIKLNQPTVLEGVQDAGSTFSTKCVLKDCEINTQLNVKNVVNIELFNCKIWCNSTIENVIELTMRNCVQGSDTNIYANTINYVAGNNKPLGITSTEVIVGSCTCWASWNVNTGSKFEVREGTKLGSNAQLVTVNGQLEAVTSFIWTSITVNAGGSFTNRGSFFDPVNLTIAGGSFNNRTEPGCINFSAAVPANWNTAPGNLQLALDELAARVKGLGG